MREAYKIKNPVVGHPVGQFFPRRVECIYPEPGESFFQGVIYLADKNDLHWLGADLSYFDSGLDFGMTIML